MLWVFLQVFLAFGVAVFIVWWTFPRNEKSVAATQLNEEADVEKPAGTEKR